MHKKIITIVNYSKPKTLECSDKLKRDGKHSSSKSDKPSSKHVKDDKGKCKETKEHKSCNKDHKDRDHTEKREHKEKKKIKKSSPNDGGIDCNSGMLLDLFNER